MARDVDHTDRAAGRERRAAGEGVVAGEVDSAILLLLKTASAGNITGESIANPGALICRNGMNFNKCTGPNETMVRPATLVSKFMQLRSLYYFCMPFSMQCGIFHFQRTISGLLDGMKKGLMSHAGQHDDMVLTALATPSSLLSVSPNAAARSRIA
jgi:hypothetical protein